MPPTSGPAPLSSCLRRRKSSSTPPPSCLLRPRLLSPRLVLRHRILLHSASYTPPSSTCKLSSLRRHLPLPSVYASVPSSTPPPAPCPHLRYLLLYADVYGCLLYLPPRRYLPHRCRRLTCRHLSSPQFISTEVTAVQFGARGSSILGGTTYSVPYDLVSTLQHTFLLAIYKWLD
ncbi:hypothetical protein BDD12DRAFT_258368 [Trichophaea hybrida]|nr:hypothetical protein BDD12DRAFT_258368 [Trichophaea hybrida]